MHMSPSCPLDWGQTWHFPTRLFMYKASINGDIWSMEGKEIDGIG